MFHILVIIVEVQVCNPIRKILFMFCWEDYYSTDEQLSSLSDIVLCWKEIKNFEDN